MLSININWLRWITIVAASVSAVLALIATLIKYMRTGEVDNSPLLAGITILALIIVASINGVKKQ